MSKLQKPALREIDLEQEPHVRVPYIVVDVQPAFEDGNSYALLTVELTHNGVKKRANFTVPLEQVMWLTESSDVQLREKMKAIVPSLSN